MKLEAFMISSKLIEIAQKAICQSNRRNNHQDGDSVNLCYDLSIK